ncbi:hypothetical protein, partial [Bacillus thuringiensis]|uniref:hypothetical protein n=1 Tax=Bacillus thuringiensis TaxID=1428 RepID=UPI003000433D
FIVLTPYRLIYAFIFRLLLFCFVFQITIAALSMIELYYVGFSKLFALLIHHSYSVLIYDFIKQKSACT